MLLQTFGWYVWRTCPAASIPHLLQDGGGRPRAGCALVGTAMHSCGRAMCNDNDTAASRMLILVRTVGSCMDMDRNVWMQLGGISGSCLSRQISMCFPSTGNATFRKAQRNTLQLKVFNPFIIRVQRHSFDAAVRAYSHTPASQHCLGWWQVWKDCVNTKCIFQSRVSGFGLTTLFPGSLSKPFPPDRRLAFWSFWMTIDSVF